MPDAQPLQASFNWLATVGPGIASAVVVLVLGWFLARLASRTVRRLLPRTPGVDRNFTPLLSEVARYGILIFAIVTALGFLGVASASIYAVLGAAGLAVALALQGTLSNIAAGIMLLWQRPIAIGEYITGDGVAGVVVEIGLFGTRLRTSSGLYVFTPNQKLWAGAITNHSREPRRRVDVLVNIPDTVDLAVARDALLDVARADERVLRPPDPSVHVDSFAGDRVNLQLRAWVKTPDYLETLYTLTEASKLALRRITGGDAGAGQVSAQVGAVPDPMQPSPDAPQTPFPG